MLRARHRLELVRQNPSSIAPTAQVGLANEARSTAGTLAKSKGRVQRGCLPQMMRDHVGISYLQWLSCEWMQISLEKASQKFPELISLVERGESITITRNEIPIAEASVCWNYVKGLSCERMEVSVEEAREKLPELITLVERGEFITITRDEIPVADLMPSLEREG